MVMSEEQKRERALTPEQAVTLLREGWERLTEDVDEGHIFEPGELYAAGAYSDTDAAADFGSALGVDCVILSAIAVSRGDANVVYAGYLADSKHYRLYHPTESGE